MLLQQTEETSLSRRVNYIFGSLAHRKCASDQQEWINKSGSTRVDQQEWIISKSSEAVSSDPFLNLTYYIYSSPEQHQGRERKKTWSNNQL